MAKDKSIRIGISACLLGEKVRFDGGHKQQRFCTDELSKYVEYTPICPEVAVGLGTPRPTIRLVNDGEIKVQTSDYKQDHTKALREFSNQITPKLGHLSGYIVCAKSPTCGMERVSVYKAGTNNATREGIGVFTQRLMEVHPNLPIEENGRLNDHNLRENFVTRIFAYHQWHQLMEAGVTKDALFNYHGKHKYLLMAHCPQRYRELGSLLGSSTDPIEQIAEQYISGFMGALKQHATRKAHSNVLQHIQGYLKKQLSSDERQSMANCIDSYRVGKLPLLAPIALLKHYLTLYPNDYLLKQVYLNPHPEEMQLRYEH
ncbi:YbgA family protein [Ferrimonas aestuarii]|uniref:DUF1722 domain-containing protein n=1 Tax=Ferrimonas aestuarii TaxID=2569539 RepID=A0A4U1BQR9_9GAMM|nr:DUF523 and DUF1722 domain-containing protein [Ferrimonas aestuarii]TKB57377.1 DUF1722 domain-containing protein [Ferrimonas aestuarii]